METGMGLFLTFVALGGHGHMLKVLAEAAHIPSSKAHRYLLSMIRMGFVDRDPANGRYRLGTTRDYPWTPINSTSRRLKWL